MSHRYRVSWQTSDGTGDGEFGTNERGAAIARAYREEDKGACNVRVLDRHMNKEIEL